jgi:hypothetical protein
MRPFRWEPKAYWQVWLTAAAVGVISLIPWSVHGEPVAGAVFGGFITLASGAAGSYRLGRRTDASTIAQWTATRRLPPPRP